MKKSLLWAPWRMDYISNPKREKDIFLKKAKSKDDRENLVLFRGNNVFVVMNLYPYNNGHLMIVPFEKYDDMTDLDDEILFEIISTSKKCMKILKSKEWLLIFEAYNQYFELFCEAKQLKKDDPFYISTWWHNSLFNPSLHPETIILSFNIDWSKSMERENF